MAEASAPSIVKASNTTTTASPSSNPAAAPSATITPTHFQHRTTTAAPVNPLIDTATPAINTVPIELDSTPVTSPVTGNNSGGGGRSASWNIKEAIQDAEKKVHAVFSKNSSGESSNNSVTKSIGGPVAASSIADGSSKLRHDNAAVMAGPPGTPGPEDFEAAKIDVAITPS